MATDPELLWPALDLAAAGDHLHEAAVAIEKVTDPLPGAGNRGWSVGAVVRLHYAPTDTDGLAFWPIPTMCRRRGIRGATWPSIAPTSSWSPISYCPKPYMGFTVFSKRLVFLDRYLHQNELRSTLAHEIAHLEQGPAPRGDGHR